MPKFISVVVLLASLAMPVTLLEAPATAAPGGASGFTPKAGPTFNSPLGDRPTRRAIFNKILRSIDSAPRGSHIKFFTWNLLTSEGVDALLRAQRRGVTVRLLMDKSNDTNFVNGPFRRLRSGLRTYRDNHPKKPKPWARLCTGSCRGQGGSAHSKFFMFSQAGKARRVVIQGSANFTLAATNNQWNDVYTSVNDKGAWRFYSKVFAQAAKDKPVKPAMMTLKGPRRTLIQFPITKRLGDPVMQLLNQVKCKGATNTASKRTRLRIAPDVIRTDRGMRLAKKLRTLWNRGCDVKIGYTVVGIDIGRYLRAPGGRGPVPMKHLVQDFNGDGQFDNYFHLKAMSIVGNVGGKRGNYVVLNGSANWSGLAAASDENLGIYWRKNLTRRYEKHIDYWYNNFPRSTTSVVNSTNPTSPTDPATTLFARTAAQADQLVFGAGKNAVYEDGTPYSLTGVDPYAQLELD